jgi:hypothetical protein
MKQVALCISAIALFLTSVASAGLGSDEANDFRYSAILKLQPALPKQRAKRIAHALEQVGRTCTIPWPILVSIAFNESSLGINTLNPETQDFGLMQVNEKNFLRYGLSQSRLMKDEAYSLTAACRILEENQARYGKRLTYWLGLYRSGTAIWEARVRENAKRYDRMIRKTALRIGYKEQRAEKSKSRRLQANR